MTFNKRLQGPVYGALTGVLYWIFEYLVVMVAPMARWSPASLIPNHWIWEAALLSIYAASGAAIAGITTAIFRGDFRPTATRSVVAVVSFTLFMGRVLSQQASAPNLVLDAALAVVAVLLARSVFVPSPRIWVSWMCSPWVSIPVILCFIKLKGQFRGAGALGASIVTVGTGIVLAVYVSSRSRVLCRALKDRFLPFTASACGVLAMAIVPVSVWLTASPRIPEGRASAAFNRSRPDILLIVLDTARADHLSLYGYERRTTPNLEALASEGVLYRNAVSTSDITLSSHASIFTGLYPSWHGAYLRAQQASRLDPSSHTLAEILSENGYTTLAVLANCAYLRPVFGMDQGFDLYDVRTPVNGSGGGGYYLRDIARAALDHFVSTAEFDRTFRRADQITDDGIRIFNVMRQRGKPFFLNLNYMDAHDPYIPPSLFRDLFPGRNPAFKNTERVHELHRELALFHRPVNLAADLAHIVSQYDGGIAFLDAELKRLFDSMKQAGLYDNALIIITSDHGESLGERSALGHPASVHQNMVHVPLWIKYPRPMTLAAERQVDTLVSGVDLMPTMLDVAGAPVPGGLHGESLLKLNRQAERTVISESFPDSLSRLRRRSDSGQRAIFEDRWKFIGDTNGKKELYDLSRDPGESQNLYNAEDPVSRRLGAALDKWIQAIPVHKRAPKEMDRQTMDRLRSLGYVQ